MVHPDDTPGFGAVNLVGKVVAWKAIVRVIVPGVRVPLAPPEVTNVSIRCNSRTVRSDC